MRPTVSFAPLDQFLAITYGCQWADFLVCIHTFFDNRTNRILSDRIRTDVNTMQVTTRTGDKETVIVAQPDTCHLFPVTIFLSPRLTCQAQRLVFECGRADFFIAIVVHVEQEQVFDGCFFLTGHLVFIGFQRRTGRSHRVDNPEIFHGTLVRGRYGKITGIG